MGGGAAMRAAAKVAGTSILNGGLRGIVPDNPVAAAARKTARPAGLFTSSSSSLSPLSSFSSSSTDTSKTSAAGSGGIDQESVKVASWDIDEWEFAGGDEELLGVSGGGIPRIVFGGAPTIDEAKEATSELKDVLEKAYLSSSPMTPTSPISSRLSHSEVLETKLCVTSETTVESAAPKHAMQAFRFLNESPVAQNVVASIASDPNVWNAVLHNPALQDYLQSQHISVSNVDQYEKESTRSDILFPRSPRSHDGAFGYVESGESTPQTGFMEYFQNLKHSVVDMMNNLSDYFQNLFGGYYGEKDTKDNIMSGFMDKALGPSLMGLAVMVIMVVLFKRA